MFGNAAAENSPEVLFRVSPRNVPSAKSEAVESVKLVGDEEPPLELDPPLDVPPLELPLDPPLDVPPPEDPPPLPLSVVVVVEVLDSAAGVLFLLKHPLLKVINVIERSADGM